MSNRFNKRYDKQVARRGRKKKKSGKKSSGRRSFLVALAVGALALCFAIGFFLTQVSEGDSTEFPRLASIYNGGEIADGDLPILLPENENRRQQVLARMSSNPVSQDFAPVHIFKEDQGTRRTRWIASGVFHRPSGLIATVEHMFPAKEPPGYYHYCFLNEDLPKLQKEAKYIEEFLPVPVYEFNDVAVLKTGKRQLIAGKSIYADNLKRMSQFAIKTLEAQSFAVTSLVDGKTYQVKAGLALIEELGPSLNTQTNRFVVVSENPIIVGQSGEGYLGNIKGHQVLMIQSGYYENLPDDLKKVIRDLLKVSQEGASGDLCVVYSFPLKVLGI